MNELWYSLLWIVWGSACFVSGGYLIGPTIYHRQLVKTIARSVGRQRGELSPDEMQQRISDAIRNDVR